MCHLPQGDRLTVSVPLSTLVPPKDHALPPQLVLCVASGVCTGQEENMWAGFSIANETEWYKTS